MISEEAFKHLTDNLSEEAVLKFVQKNANEFVHFYLIYENSLAVTEIKTFEAGEMKVPTRTGQEGELFVIYTNKPLAVKLIEGGFRIGTVRLSEAISIARTTTAIDGLYFQGNDSWFSVSNEILDINQLS